MGFTKKWPGFLAVKMALVADTALNHHSLTHSLCFSIARSTFMKEGFSIGNEHRMAMWNVNVESEPTHLATAC